MRLLIYGAGVIGCLYATLFSEAGYDTTVYARGKRLISLKKDGLLYKKNGKIYKAKIGIIEELRNDDMYDYIFLTVKGNQVDYALGELSYNKSSNIVTMANTVEKYECWEKICGSGRIIPAFPGAGGSIEQNILDASLIPKFVQYTSFAEINGEVTERIKILATIFKKSGVPYRIEKDMHQWQLCHLAMVVPIADAYYRAKNPGTVWTENEVMIEAAKQMKRNFNLLYSRGVILTPMKAHMLRLLPANILSLILKMIFKSKFGHKFMYQHAIKAPDEMRELHSQFYQYINE